MQKFIFILAVSLMISACGHDYKSPTNDTEPEPGYLSDMDQVVCSERPADLGMKTG